VAKKHEHFREFKPHTRLKHMVLETYLQTWARKLLLRKDASNRVFYVDACAGPGMDDAGNHGSPVVAAVEAANVKAQFREKFGRTVEVTVIAVEKDIRRFRALKNNLAPFGISARALRGTLTDHMPELLSEMGEAPALFFIDPFGIEPLRGDVVCAAIARAHSEVLLLFADQAALRHYGVISADFEEPGEQGDLLASFGALYEQQEADILAAKAEELEPTREACEEIMETAFAGWDWRSGVDAAPRAKRRQVIVDEYARMLHAIGAKYVLQMPIVRVKQRHVYHLFHATKSATGYSTMKSVVDTALRKSRSVGSAVDAIRYLVRSDMDAVEQSVRRALAGQLVPWSENGSAPSVRNWALRNTPAYPVEMGALKDRLRDLRYPSAGRRLVYRFPSMD
jgi:three-Cys-motif partner protein